MSSPYLFLSNGYAVLSKAKRQSFWALTPALNWLLRKFQSDVVECLIDDPAVITDIDTPEDYERLLRQVDLDR